jgi:hypothetical protein
MLTGLMPWESFAYSSRESVLAVFIPSSAPHSRHLSCKSLPRNAYPSFPQPALLVMLSDIFQVFHWDKTL